MVGALTARSEAQALRVSGLFALLDRSAVVQQQHVRAALALAEYNRASIAFFRSDKGPPR